MISEHVSLAVAALQQVDEPAREPIAKAVIAKVGTYEEDGKVTIPAWPAESSAQSRDARTGDPRLWDSKELSSRSLRPVRRSGSAIGRRVVSPIIMITGILPRVIWMVWR